ncbi:MAG: hypothetical protein WCR27_07110, partial [Eubacteriales bacterium]
MFYDKLKSIFFTGKNDDKKEIIIKEVLIVLEKYKPIVGAKIKEFDGLPKEDMRKYISLSQIIKTIRVKKTIKILFKNKVNQISIINKNSEEINERLLLEIYNLMRYKYSEDTFKEINNEIKAIFDNNHRHYNQIYLHKIEFIDFINDGNLSAESQKWALHQKIYKLLYIPFHIGFIALIIALLKKMLNINTLPLFTGFTLFFAYRIYGLLSNIGYSQSVLKDQIINQALDRYETNKNEDNWHSKFLEKIKQQLGKSPRNKKQLIIIAIIIITISLVLGFNNLNKSDNSADTKQEEQDINAVSIEKNDVLSFLKEQNLDEIEKTTDIKDISKLDVYTNRSYDIESIKINFYLAVSEMIENDINIENETINIKVPMEQEINIEFKNVISQAEKESAYKCYVGEMDTAEGKIVAEDKNWNVITKSVFAKDYLDNIKNEESYYISDKNE